MATVHNDERQLPHYLQVEVEHVVEYLSEKGYSDADVGRIMHRHRSTIGKMLSKAGRHIIQINKNK